ncbi:Ig-like domain-containing protein [Psychrobacter proteolyticus]|uniref:Ig-like domain-containing protein n=1 Tax=Psychrobacter proteolyticus TaxID=147825 RepID=UPI000E0B6060|nr:Ig-like domain-containing protein [Psychrobacter proteolyticus]
MKTITVKANNQVGTVTEHTVVTQTNTPTVIKATDKTNYEIFDTVEGRAPKDIITKRVDKDLHVSFENDIQNTDLIIEGFYDNIDSALIGVADDGSYYYYVPDTGEMTDYVTELQMGEVQSQSLGGNSYATPWWIGATEAEGLSALPWLFGLAGVGIAAGSLGGSDSSSNSPVDTMAPDAPTSINVGNGDAFITADEITDGQVSVVVGLPSNAVSGDVVIVNGTEQNLSEDDILNGNVIVQVNAPAEGELFNVSATLRDEAGNESDALDTTVGVVDTIAPDTPAAAPEISDNVANDGSGDVLDPAEIIGADGLTNDSTPSVVVPADQLANGTPQLVIDGVVVASIAETNTDGSVSLTPTDPLLDGEYDVSYNIKDAAGNVSGNAPVVTVIVDTTTSITIIEPIAGDNVINGDEAAEGFNVRGTGTAGDTVTLTNGLGTVIGSGVVSDNGQWIINVNSVQINAMGEGAESLTATAKDAAGNAAVATADITVVSATTVSISSPIAGDNVINADEAAEGFDVRGTGTAGDTITLFSESGNIIGTAIVDANNKWIIPVDEDDVDEMGQGAETLTVQAEDAVGNISTETASITVGVDTIAPGGGTDATQVAPVVAIAEAADGVNATEFQNGVQTQVTLPTGTIAGDIVTLTVTPDGGAPITVDYVVTAEDLSGDGIAEVTIPNNTIGGITADGDYSVTAVVTDAAGNSSAVSDAVGFTVDVTIIAQDDTANLDLALQVTTLVAISEEESTILEALETNNGTESNLSFTVNDNTSGTVNIELTESALVQVADAISLEVYNSDNELVYIAANVNNPLVGNVAGLEVLGLTNNNGSLTATLSGLEPGNYKIVVSKDSSTLETLINDLTVSELGEAGVVLGTDNQDAILDAVETGLGFPLGSTVRATLEMALNLTTDLGVGEFLSIAQPILIAAGAPIDPLLDAVAAEVLSNTLALLETTEVTATLTEYSFDNNTVVSGNVIDPDLNSIGEIGEDIVTANTVLTNIIGANGIATSTQLDGVNAFSINGEYGVLIIDEYGKYEYRANGDYASSGQSDVFTYTIFDDVTGASDTAELVIDLTYTIDMAAGDDIVNITDNVLQSSLDGLDDNANTINIDSSLSVNIIGGEGFDTINLTGAGQTLSLSDIFQTEVVDISGTGANTLTLQAADITNSGTSDPIYVKGDSDDTVDLGGVGADLSDTDGANSPSVWVDAGTDVTDTNGQVYNVWQLDNNAATQVYIDTDITVI